MTDDDLGARVKVRLTADLTKYGAGLVPGIEGVTVGRHGEWSKGFDWFITVNFPSASRTLDVLWKSLEVIKEDKSGLLTTEQASIEEYNLIQKEPISDEDFFAGLGYKDREDYMAHLDERVAKREREEQEAFIKSVRNVVKTIGPSGGFLSLEYDYIDSDRQKSHKRITSRYMYKSEEELFNKFDIPIRVEKLKNRPKPKKRSTELRMTI